MPESNIVRNIIINILSILRNNNFIEKNVTIFNISNNYKEGEAILQNTFIVTDNIEMLSKAIKESGLDVVELRQKIINNDTIIFTVFSNIKNGEIVYTIEIGIHPDHKDILNVAISLTSDEEPTIVIGE